MEYENITFKKRLDDQTDPIYRKPSVLFNNDHSNLLLVAKRTVNQYRNWVLNNYL